MMDTASPRSGRARTVLLPALILLGLSGIALRIPILAVPPLLPLIRDEFRMSETQIGALMSMPLALFALAAVPGSLLVARLGARTTLLGGLLIAAFASGARGFAMGPFTLYLASILMGAATAVTFGPTLALAPALSRPNDVHRTAAGTFAIGYCVAVIIPVLCGAFWDYTGIYRLAFVPIGACAIGLTVFGALMSRFKPYTAATPVAQNAKVTA